MSRVSRRVGLSTRGRWIEQAGPVKFSHDGHDAAGPVDIFHMVMGRRRNLAQVGHFAGQSVDVRHGKVDPRLMGDRQQMQHGIGRAAHGDVKCHGIHEGGPAGDRAGSTELSSLSYQASAISTIRSAACSKSSLRLAWVATTVPLPGRARPRASFRQFMELAVNIPEQEPQVGQAQRSTSADFFVAYFAVGGHHHGIDQIVAFVAVNPRFHGAAGDENGRDIEAHGGHQHAGSDFVAVGDADHGIDGMGIAHVLDAVGDQFAGRQGIEHAVMAHGNSVVDGDRIEFGCKAARFVDNFLHMLTDFMEMDMAGHQLGERIDDRDNRPAELLFFHAVGPPEAAGSCHSSSLGGCCTA